MSASKREQKPTEGDLNKTNGKTVSSFCPGWLQKRSRVTPKVLPTSSPKWPQSDPRMTSEWLPSGLRMTPKWLPSDPSIIPKIIHNWPQSDLRVTSEWPQSDRNIICIEALKMSENAEKQCFTFFAFLPSYFGVSCSLVPCMRKSVKRSIDWYQKFLISCLPARYSTVFVLKRSKWLKMRKNYVLRFLPFYHLIAAFQALSCLARARSRWDLSIGIKNS